MNPRLLRNVPICASATLGAWIEKAPCTVDMADDGQRAAIRMREQAAWQRGNERLRRQRRRFAGLQEIHRELIRARSAVPEAGEQQRDESVYVGVVGDIGRSKEMLGSNGAKNPANPGKARHPGQLVDSAGRI